MSLNINTVLFVETTYRYDVDEESLAPNWRGSCSQEKAPTCFFCVRTWKFCSDLRFECRSWLVFGMRPLV